MAERSDVAMATRRETVSLLAHAIVTRVAAQIRRSGPAQLQPTIYLGLRRGEDPSWKDVVARSV